MLYDFLIIGSGLSASCFLHGLKNTKKKIGLISWHNKIQNSKIRKINSYNFPAKINMHNLQGVNDFNKYLNANISNKLSIFGSLAKGGNSDFWGFNYELGDKKECNYLNFKNFLELKNSFKQIYKDFSFTGESCDGFVRNNKKIDNYFNQLLKNNKKTNIDFYNCSLAIVNKNIKKIKKCNYKNNNCWIKCPSNSTFIPENYFKNFNNTNYKHINGVVLKFKKKNNIFEIICKNNKSNFILKSKKIILASGTISTTKLVCDYLNYNGTVRLIHNPMILFSYFSQRKIIKNLNFWPAQLTFKIKNEQNEKYSFGSLRSINRIIINKISLNYGIFGPFIKLILNLLKKYICLGQLYLDGNYSLLKMDFYKGKLKKIYPKGDQIIINNTLKKYLKILITNLQSFDKSCLLLKNIIPKLGSDFHYFGTIPIKKNNNNEILSVDQYCRLKGSKNLFIIDGSVISKISSKFPTGILMANAYRIGRYLKKKDENS